MSSATLEKPEQMVAVPDRDIVFMARHRDLRLVMSRKWDRKDGEGNVIETLPGKHLRFTDGVLRVPASGKMRGEAREELDVAEVLAFLESHPKAGDRQEGFWRHQEAPPIPTQEERDKLGELSMDLDVAGLEAFIEQERAGWKRKELLALADSSLERARVKVAERDEALAAARAEGAEQASKAAGASKPGSGTVKAS